MEDYNAMSHRYPVRYLIAALALALAAGACSSSDSASEQLVAGGTRETITVEANLDLAPLHVNVLLTDEGMEPDLIFLPAGRMIELVLRNRGTTEHHYRIKGLIPTQLRWLQWPVVDEYEALSMTDEELAEVAEDLVGVTDEAEMAHLMHHLKPTFVPFKDESPTGIRVLGTEVHGYVGLGQTETMIFIPLQTGEYQSDDVRFPEITGRVIVFTVDGA